MEQTQSSLPDSASDENVREDDDVAEQPRGPIQDP